MSLIDARWLAFVVATLVSPSVFAADLDRGRRLAEQHCSACHVIDRRADVVADAPPFYSIARKYLFDPTAIAQAILGPHPKMNFRPEPEDAADIAAHIAQMK
jgi:mono/diheme cytochrome c family protein